MSTARVQKKSKPCAACAGAGPARSTPVHAPPAGALDALGPPIGLVQKKATVGPVDDAYEQEADAAAEAVASGAPVPSVQRMATGDAVARAPDETVQREADEAVQRAPDEAVQRAPDEAVQRAPDEAVQLAPEEAVQRAPDEAVQRAPDEAVQRAPDEAVQRDADGGGGAPSGGASSMDSAASHAIATSGPGSPMLGPTRSTLESSFGVDLGGVRVHEGSHAASSARQLGARAFTHKSDVWLGAGESQSDTKLMAHETTHVLQQDGVVRRSCPPGGAGFAAIIASQLRTAREDAGAPTLEGEAPAAEGAGGAGAGGPASSGPTAEGAPTAEGVVAPEGEATAEGPEAAGAEGEGAEGEVAEAPAAAEAPSVEPVVAGGPGEAEGGVELLMPAPPDRLSPEAMARVAGVAGRASETAERQRTLPPATDSVGGARGAVTEPEAETAGRAEAGLIADLEAQAQPSPEIEELCTRIREVICNKRPPDEDSLVEADPEEMAREAGGELNTAVEGDADRVAGQYESIDSPPAGEAALAPEAIEDPAARVETPGLNAGAATPDAVPAEDVSLDADVEANRARIDDAGMNSPPALLVEGGPIAEAREAQGDLEETAARDPAEVLAEQQAALASADADMQALQLQAAQALQAAREGTIEDTRGQQDSMVESEQQTRERVSREAQEIFESTRSTVMGMIEPLSRNAMARWTAGVELHSTTFKNRLARVASWIEDRHSGVGGFLTGLGDAVFGLPDWVTEEYDAAESQFGDNVCALIREISTEVNSVIVAAEQLITSAEQRISTLFSNLGPGLEDWATQQQAQFSERLAGLTQTVHQTRDDFNRDLRQRAAQAVQDVRTEIHGLRQAARGLIGRIADAIDRFLDDPAKFIIDGLLELLGISPSAFWAVVRRIGEVIDQIADDPEAFANNLMAALKKGFEQFFDNIGTHLLNGFLQWLFSGLGSVGVEIPRDFSLKSVITFFLQLMGITWPRIRRLIARHIGEENVALIEQAYEIVSLLIEKGPEGIFEMIEDQLNPQNILDMILDAAIDYLIEALITRVTARIVMMFNPAGAILQAIEAIYRVLKWVFENAARIFSLIETIVNGIADVLAGNIQGMADAVERALAGLIPPVIDFLAGYLGLGGLPDAIANAVRGMQNWIEGILDRVIGWLAGQARRLLRALGLGGEDEEDEDDEGTDHESIARRATSDLQSVPSTAETYDQLRAEKETQAREIEERYAPVLEEGIGIRIEFTPRAEDEGDNDIDFEVVIAPNTTRRRGAVPGPTNVYKATRGRDGKIRGAFADFVWTGYPSHSVTPHPVNSRYRHRNGTTIPQPTGRYTVPTGRAYGGAPSTAAWRARLYAERDAEKSSLRALHPTWSASRIDRTAKQNLESNYGMTWLDLDLRGWEAHHIHPRDWGGRDSAGNWQYVKENANAQPGGAPGNQHSPFTTWWDTVRKPDIESKVP